MKFLFVAKLRQKKLSLAKKRLDVIVTNRKINYLARWQWVDGQLVRLSERK